ncbi:MAG: TIM barrel protein [Oscillospiraceae bacterium]|nr:TIM barrel protein [Oscillospiraceae bacterium]MBR2635991.1 TIM barrel protein [Oscillospiraceae bacterium]
MIARFGPAGSADSFHTMGYRKTAQMPEYLTRMELDAFEYQCGRGVRISREAAQELGRLSAEKDIRLSLHAPYFISLSSLEEEKRMGSIDYILQSAVAADAMGADRIIVHSGSASKISRSDALELAKDTLRKAQKTLDEQGLSHIHICPETMGKINQLGDLDEVLQLCLVDERFIPCIDFGHLNARTVGRVNSFEDVGKVFEAMENTLGTDRMRAFHSHFSKIEYTEKGGEKRHLTFEDTVYGPNFEPVVEWILRKNAYPTVICESAGTQAEDAAMMRRYYHSLMK